MKWLFLVCFIFLSSLSSHAFLVDKIVGVVNGEVILLSDIVRFEKTISLRQELDPIFGFSVGMENGKPNREQILEFLIQDQLISQTFKVSDTETEQEVQSVQKNNHLNRDDLIKFLKSKGFTYEDYFEVMRSGLQKRALLDREIRNRVNITDDDVRNYFYNNISKDGNAPVEYHIELISFDLKKYKNQASAEKYANEIYRSLLQGDSFSETAKRVSDDATAEQGGDLGFVSAEVMAEPLKVVTKKLKIAEISKPFKTSVSYVILKLVDIRSTESSKLNENKEQIREQLAKEEYKKQILLWADRSRNNAFVINNSLN